MSRTALPPLAAIAKEAGEVIKAMQPDIVARKDWIVKPDKSPVSPADKKAHAMIKERIAALASDQGEKNSYRNIGFVSEEASPEDNAAGLARNDRIETDPLDNTGGYIKGLDGYSVNIGRVKDGVPVEGAIYFPAREELYYTGANGKAYFQKGDAPPEEISVSGLPMRNPLEVAVGNSEQNVGFLGERPHKMQRYPGQYRTCMVARGQCDLTGLNKGATGGFESWDTAGPHAVLLAAGGDFVTEDGKPMRYDGQGTVLPHHIAGSVDVLKALGLADPAYFKGGAKRGA